MISTIITELTAGVRLNAELTVRRMVRMVVMSLAALMALLGMVIYLANALHRVIAERADPIIADLSLAGAFLVLLLIIVMVLNRPRRRVVVRPPLDEPSAARASSAGKQPAGASAGLSHNPDDFDDDDDGGSMLDGVWPPKKSVVFGAMAAAVAIGFGIGRKS